MHGVLNAATVNNTFPLPNIHDALEGPSWAVVFSALHLAVSCHWIVLN